MQNPNQRKITLSVRSTRCSSKSILSNGVIFFVVASILFGVRIAKFSSLGFALIPLNYYWVQGYPLLIGLWNMVVGSVGICASNQRRSGNKCLTATFGIFCIGLISVGSYFIDEFRGHLENAVSLARHASAVCSKSTFYTNCYFNVAVYGVLILFEAMNVLHSIWCVICCLGSLLCAAPDEQPSAQQVATSSPEMMMQNQPPMYNPGLQASTDNLHGNAPMPYNSGAPMGPTMQGNMPMQGNAPMPYNSGAPIDPTMQGNMPMQGNAPMPYNSGAPMGPTMQGNMPMQGNAPMPYNSGAPMDPTMQGNMPMQGNPALQQPNAPPIYPTLQENKESSVQGNAI